MIYSNEEYGVGLSTAFEQHFAEIGGTVVAKEAFNSGEVDLRTQLTKIKAVNPETIFIISNSPDSSVAILKQIKELAISMQLYGSEALYGAYIVDNAKDAAEGMIVTSVTVGTDAFKARHLQVYGIEPGPFSAFGYAAFQAVARALQKGAKTSEEIKNALYTV